MILILILLMIKQYKLLLLLFENISIYVAYLKHKSIYNFNTIVKGKKKFFFFTCFIF